MVANQKIVAAINELACARPGVSKRLVVIELKARFDEAANIKWARTLHEAGVHVIYGIASLMTRAKLALVVRERRGRYPSLPASRDGEL